MINEKYCPVCGELRDIDEFILTGIGGEERRRYYCDSCASLTPAERRTMRQERNGKRCPSCGEWKPLTEFTQVSEDRKHKFHKRYCKSCEELDNIQREVMKDRKPTRAFLETQAARRRKNDRRSREMKFKDDVALPAVIEKEGVKFTNIEIESKVSPRRRVDIRCVDIQYQCPVLIEVKAPKRGREMIELEAAIGQLAVAFCALQEKAVRLIVIFPKTDRIVQVIDADLRRRLMQEWDVEIWFLQ